jgi:probable addiction module antidote protein
MIKLTDFDVADFLRDPAAAAEYLNTIIEDGGQDEFIEALNDLARAQGVTDLAGAANISQDDVDKWLRDGANPTLATIRSILSALGLQLLVIPQRTA